MTVGSIVGGGIRLMQNRPRTIAIWMVLHAAMSILTRIAMLPFANSMALYRSNLANAGAAALPAMPFSFALMGVIGLLQMVIVVVAFAAVVRAATWDREDRFAYLRLGMDELRLVGLGFILAALAILLEIVAVLAISAATAAFFAILGSAAVTPMVLIGAALLCAIVYAEVRISLAGPLTVMKRRIVIKDAWQMTKGHFWTLFGAYWVLVLIYLVCFGVAMGAYFVMAAPQLFTAGGLSNPQALKSMLASSQAQGFSAATIVQTLLGSLLMVPAGVIALGGIAEAARELSGPGETVAELFE